MSWISHIPTQLPSLHTKISSLALMHHTSPRIASILWKPHDLGIDVWHLWSSVSVATPCRLSLWKNKFEIVFEIADANLWKMAGEKRLAAEKGLNVFGDIAFQTFRLKFTSCLKFRFSSGAWRGAPDGVATLKVRKGAFNALNKGSGALGKVK